MYEWLRNRNLPLMEQDTGDKGGAATTESADKATDKTTDKADKADDKAKGGEKTFTQADLDAIMDKKFAKWQKDTDAKVAAAKTEAEKLAKLTADEKAAYEKEQADAKLKQREAEITRRELRAQALETLAEKDLPKELADVLDYSDADKCNASVTAVEKAFRSAVKKAVDEKLKGNPPPAGGKPSETLEQAITNAMYHHT